MSLLLSFAMFEDKVYFVGVSERGFIGWIIIGLLAGWIAKVLADLSSTVYITIDVAGFDPSVVPATGNPDPGGLDWHQVTSLLRAVAGHKKVVGMDVVELRPQAGQHASDFLAAKLVYKCLGYVFCQG